MMRTRELGSWARMPLPADCRWKDGPAVARDEALIGCIGKIVVATRGPAGPGEVEVSIRGGREALIAWSAEPLPKGSTVLVIESRGHRAVDVSPWSDPLEDFAEDPAG